MTLAELMEGFTASIGLSGSIPDADGRHVLSFDDLAVTFEETDGAVFLSAQLGEKPTEEGDRLATLLLAANDRLAATAGNVLAFDAGANAYVLQRRETLVSLSQADFRALVESFVNKAHDYRRLVAEFSPAFAAAEAQRAENRIAESGFRSEGFVRV